MSIKKSVCSLLVLLLFLGAVTSAPFGRMSTASAATVSDYQQYIKDLEAEQKELKEQIAALKGDKSNQQALKNALQKNIDNLQSQISASTAQIAETEAKISQLEADVVKKNNELEETKYMFRQRLRAIYMSGGMSNSSLVVLFEAQSLEELLTKSELTKSISAYDSALMQKIVDDMKAIEAAKAEVLVLKDENEANKAVLEEKKGELMLQIKEVNSSLADINGDIGSIQDKIEQLQQAQKEYEQAIKDAQHVGSDQKYEGGEFAWPVPGYYYVSSPYGYRNDPWTGSKKFHKGIDIAGSGIKGKPIVAAADGIVSLAKYNTGGYGHYVMINHGTDNSNDTYVTLYAHMTKYIVSVGQKVKKGQTIGYVGSTGASTGYHLHFEIRVNGNTVNPLSYY